MLYIAQCKVRTSTHMFVPLNFKDWHNAVKVLHFYFLMLYIAQCKVRTSTHMFVPLNFKDWHNAMKVLHSEVLEV